MSEKTEVELKEEDRKLLRSAISAADRIEKAAQTEPKATQGKQASESESKHEVGHATLDDLLACPNCYPQVKKAVFKKETENLRSLDGQCLDCGLPVNLDDEECSWCGGKKARPKD